MTRFWHRILGVFLVLMVVPAVLVLWWLEGQGRTPFLGMSKNGEGVLVLFALLALWVGAAAWVHHTVVRPLKELERAARRVATGDLSSMVTMGTFGEAASAGDAFNQMTVDLRTARARIVAAERIATWRVIAQQLAHELKNPLSPIQLSMENVAKAHSRNHPDLEVVVQESLETVRIEIGRMRRIIQGFTDFARVPAPERSEVDLRNVLGHVEKLFSTGGTPLTVQVGPQAAIVRADSDLLVQVLFNLVQNAQEATSEQGATARIHMELRRAGDEYQIHVEDNGPGFPTGSMATHPGSLVSSKGLGRGLGIAISRRILEDQGGRLTLGSSPHLGGAQVVAHLTVFDR